MQSTSESLLSRAFYTSWKPFLHDELIIYLNEHEARHQEAHQQMLNTRSSPRRSAWSSQQRSHLAWRAVKCHKPGSGWWGEGGVLDGKREKTGAGVTRVPPDPASRDTCRRPAEWQPLRQERALPLGESRAISGTAAHEYQQGREEVHTQIRDLK